MLRVTALTSLLDGEKEGQVIYIRMKQHKKRNCMWGICDSEHICMHVHIHIHTYAHSYCVTTLDISMCSTIAYVNICELCDFTQPHLPESKCVQPHLPENIFSPLLSSHNGPTAPHGQCEPDLFQLRMSPKPSPVSYL